MLKYSILLYFLFSNILLAETLHFESGVTKNTLVELYTSEGCSSCPPAEEYLNKLKSNKELWNTWIPVAFHVDYWDYIGWRDRYARKEYGRRQSRYANIKRASTVYTPAFMVNGNSWRKGIFSRSLPVEKKLAGNLVVFIKGKFIEANFKSLYKNKLPLKLNVAVLGMGLTTNIESGENKGRKAHHEFVVVGFDTSINKTMQKNNSVYQWKMKVPKLHYSQAKNYAVAIWVSEINDPSPLQAVGSFLKKY